MNESHPEYYPLIPDAAFLYRPTLQDMLTPSGKQRLIFEGDVVLAPHQQEKLYEFGKYLHANNIVLDKYWSQGRRLKLLQSNRFNFQKTIFDMRQYLQWVRSEHPLRLTAQIQKFLSEGVVYVSGRDSKFRPIVVFDTKKALQRNLSAEDATSFLSYLFQYLIDNMMVEGQVENWVCLIDLGGMGVTDSVDVLKKVGTALSSRFHNRMGRCYILRATSTFSFLWLIAKNFLYQDTVKKISFTSKNFAKEIFEECHPSQIEEKYGGTLPNITSFWPIQNRSDNYEVVGKPSKLITPLKYYEEYCNKSLTNRKVSKKLIDMFQLKLPSKKQITSPTKISSPRQSKDIQQMTFNRPPQSPIINSQPSILKTPSDFQNFPVRKFSQTKITFSGEIKQQSKHPSKYPSSTGLFSLSIGITSTKSIINQQGNINPIIHFQLNNAKPRSFKV